MSSRHLQQMHLKFKHQISESDFLEKSVLQIWIMIYGID